MSLFVLLCFIVGLATVSGQTQPDASVVSTSGFPLASNHFALSLLNKLSEQNDRSSSPGNLFFSPYSISLAMGMLYQGTSGSTAQELESPLGYRAASLNGTDKSALTQKIKDSESSILAAKSAAKPSYLLSSGNALIVSKTFPVLPRYTENLENNFGAKVFPVDFATEAVAATNLINGWVSNQTVGKIDKLLSEPLPPQTQLALVNAVYFKGFWKNVFNPNHTLPDTFNGRNGVQYPNVSFMSLHARYGYAKLEQINSTIVELPYEGDDLSMYAILPDDETADLKQVKQQLTPAFIDQAVGQVRVKKVILRFPKFEFQTDYQLVDQLKQLGITEVFDAQKANFSDLSGSSRIVVDMVKHVATIEVNEKGSEAAAATVITATRTSAVKQTRVNFNHPFLFFIRHKQNGQILFIGEVNRL